MNEESTGLLFTPVPIDYVPHIWPDVAAVLEKSVDTAKGKFTVHDVLPRIMDETYVLWVVVDRDKNDEIIAGITTRLIGYPQGTAMAMDWIGGKRMVEWLPMVQSTLSEYAKNHGCKYLEGYGRKAWGRWLGKYGWKPDYIAYKMELG